MEHQEIISAREREILEVLRAIVIETMDFPPIRPTSCDSYLPPNMIEAAMKAIAAYGTEIPIG